MPKLTIFGIFNELLSTQNVNVARFARNIEWDFFCDFQTPWQKTFRKVALLMLYSYSSFEWRKVPALSPFQMQNAKKGELLSTNAKIAKKKVKVDMCKCVRLYIFSKNRFEKSHSQLIWILAQKINKRNSIFGAKIVFLWELNWYIWIA